MPLQKQCAQYKAITATCNCALHNVKYYTRRAVNYSIYGSREMQHISYKTSINLLPMFITVNWVTHSCDGPNNTHHSPGHMNVT